MHELSLTSNLLDIIEEQSITNKFSDVHIVQLEIGYLSCISPDALELCFNVAKRDTVAKNANLEIKRILGRVQCRTCKTTFQVTELLTPCPECDSLGHDVVDGNSLKITNLEV